MKILTRARKSEISWDQFEGLGSREDKRVFKKERKRENKMLVYICYKLKRYIAI